MRSVGLTLLVAGSLSIVAVQAGDLSVRSRFEKTFALHKAAGPELEPGAARETPAGTAVPAPGEITIGMSTTMAVGAPKLHVFERSPKAIAFKVTAMRGRTTLGTQDLCGHLDTDAWIVLPPKTSKVIVTHFVEVEGACP